MQRRPTALGKQSLQIPLRLNHAATVAQLPAVGQAMNVGIDRKRRLTERLTHHHTGRLVSDPRQLLKCLDRCGNLTAMLLEQLPELGNEARKRNVQLLLEPVNRSESEYLNRVGHAADLLEVERNVSEVGNGRHSGIPQDPAH